MHVIINKNAKRPIFLDIAWGELEEGFGFEILKTELGENGKDVLLKKAKENGIYLQFIMRDNQIDFYVEKVQKRVLVTEDLLETIRCGDGLLYGTLSKTMHMNKKDLDEALDFLEEQGLIKSEKYYHEGKGGRPTKIYYNQQIVS